MTTTWDSIREKATEVADSVSDKINELANTAGTEYSILKHKRAISLYEDEIHEIEQAMGKRVYELMQLKKIEDRELIGRCGEIDSVKKRIDEAEEEIEKLREAEAKAEKEHDENVSSPSTDDEEPVHEKENPSDSKPGEEPPTPEKN